MLSVVLEGVTVSNNEWFVLTGQQVTATLNSGGFSVAPNSTEWDWGGSIFRNYVAGNSLGNLYLFQTTADKRKDIFLFYTRKDENVTLKCKAALSFAAEAIVKPPLPNISVESRELKSKKPIISRWDIESGAVRAKDSPVTYFGYYGIVGSTYLNGQDWHDVKIDVPTPFADGFGCFVQKITPTRRLDRNTPSMSTAAKSYVNRPCYMTVCLDAGFPYPFSNSTWGVRNATGIGFDSPAQPVYVPDVDGGGTDWYFSDANDSMETWVLYQPPKKDNRPVVWIPLQKYSWGWSGSARRTPPWSLETGNATPGSPSNTDEFPQWSGLNPSPFSYGP